MKTKFLILFSFTALLNAQNLNDGVVFHYKFDNNLNDEHYNSNLTNKSSIVSDVVDSTNNESISNKSVYLNGNTSVIESEYSANTKVDFPFTISGKINSPLGESVILFRNDCDTNNYSGIILAVGATGTFAVHFGNNIGTSGPESRLSVGTSNPVFEANTWHRFVLIARSETDVDIYVDCKSVATFNYGNGGLMQYSNDNLGMQFGFVKQNNLPEIRYKGFIDDFAMWERELDLTELNLVCSLNDFSTDGTTTVEEITNNNKINVFPNPISDFVFLKSEKKINSSKIKIYDLSGKKITPIITQDDNFQIKLNTESWEKGVYIVKYGNQEFKIIKN